MAPKIDDHDIETKIKAAARFLDEGDKLKVTVRFRGREMAHPDRGRALLMAVGDKLKDHGVIERMPLLEGRQMIMVMNPVRAPQVQNVAGGAGGAVPALASSPAAHSPSPAAPRPASAVPAAQPPPTPSSAPTRPASPAPGVRPAPVAPKASTPAAAAPAAVAPTAAPPRPAPARPPTGNRVH